MNAPTTKSSCVIGSLFVDGPAGGSAAFKRLLSLGLHSGCFYGPEHRAIWEEAQKLESSRPGWVPFELVGVLEELEDADDVLASMDQAKEDAANYPERVECFAHDLVEDNLRLDFRLWLHRAYDHCKDGEDFSADMSEVSRLYHLLSYPAGETSALVSDPTLCAKNSPPPVPVIEGLVDRGEVAMVVAYPKDGKSWFCLQAARCIANGNPFLRWNTRKGSVVYINTEVGAVPWELRSRAQNQAMGIESPPLLYHLNVRGQSLTASTLVPFLRDQLARAGIAEVSAVFIDSFYTLAGSLDEAKQPDVGPFMLAIQALAEELKAAVILVHHFKKGGRQRAASQDLLDRASGSGVFARAVDVFMALTNVNGKMRLDIRRRNAPDPVPLGIALRFPLWEVVGDAPQDSPHQGREVAYTPDVVVGKFKDADAVLKWGDFIKYGIGKGSLGAALRRATQAGLVEKSGDGYRLTAEGKKVRLGHGQESQETL